MMKEKEAKAASDQSKQQAVMPVGAPVFGDEANSAKAINTNTKKQSNENESYRPFSFDNFDDYDWVAPDEL
jgi:hypothetical protein